MGEVSLLFTEVFERSHIFGAKFAVLVDRVGVRSYTAWIFFGLMCPQGRVCGSIAGPVC